LDLEYEVCSCNFTGKTTGYLFQRCAYFFEHNPNCLLSYKNNSGNGYNYIFPILSEVNYLDSFDPIVTGTYSGLFKGDKNLNFSNTGFSYWGGSSGFCYLTGSEGQITGSILITECKSNFNSFGNFYSVSFNSSDIQDTVSGRCICMNKIFKYTGLQPICITSNYGLLDIKSPILNCSLLPFNGLFSRLVGI
jgi:hypothetical protein